MSIPAISIRRPVMAFILSLLFVFLGVVSFFKVPVQDSPNITYPMIQVVTTFPGGNADIVNQTVTKIIEKQLNSIGHLQQITSASEQARSTVTLNFELGTDMVDAYSQVQNGLSQVAPLLPKEAQPPVISLANSNDAPIILLSLTGPQTLEKLNNLARTTIETQLQNVSGVGHIIISGASKEAVSILLDLNKMAASKISINEVQQAFSHEHVQLPGGFLNIGKKEYNLNLDLEYHDVDQLAKLIVGYREHSPIFLGDIATIKFGFAEAGGTAYYNNQPAIGISIIKKRGTNTVNVIHGIQERLASSIIPNLPEGIKLDVVYSQGNHIVKIVHELEQDIGLSVLTAGLVIFLFLCSMRPTLIVIGVVPVALLGATAIIYFFGYTFNAITLLALVILVGIVVDDSIVMLENIFRQKQLDKTHPLIASVKGANEMVFPILACSLSLVCIFLPIVFIGGTVGLLFKSFAIVVTSGVVISLISSVTLTPVLCARYLKTDTSSNALTKWLVEFYKSIEKFYQPCLQFALKFPWINVGIIILMGVLSVPAFQAINKTFMPAEKNTGYFNVDVQTPPGMSADYTSSRVNDAERLIKTLPYVSSTFSANGPSQNEGSISVELKPKKELPMSQNDIMNALQNQLHSLPGAMYRIQFSEQLTYELRGEDFTQLIKVSESFLTHLQKYPNLGQTYIYLAPQQPQLQAFIDRTLASSLGITAENVANALMVIGSGGVRIAQFSTDETSERYDVLLKTNQTENKNTDLSSNIYVQAGTDKNKNNQYISLNTVAGLTQSLMPTRITRSALQYSIGFSSMPSIASNQAITEIQSIAAETLPKGYTLSLTGDTASLGDTVKDVEITLALILIFLYMILASQFNSFIQPIIVMVVQPLALIGGLLILLMTHSTLNVYSMIGMLLLVGLVTKNSILLVSMANDLVKQGKSIRDALLVAAPDRMRPVLMTSIAIILAMLPPAFAIGSSYQTLALVIIGGMIISTILSLIIVPSVYLLLAKFSHMTKAEQEEMQQIDQL
jgi:hydrophobic/amphiphilic exporter-1 (mainly G- bacteria), HAE1 family